MCISQALFLTVASYISIVNQSACRKHSFFSDDIAKVLVNKGTFLYTR